MKNISPEKPVTQKGKDAIIPTRCNGCISEDSTNNSFHIVKIIGGRIDSHIISLNCSLLHPQGCPCIFQNTAQIKHANAYDTVNEIDFLTIPSWNEKL